MNLILEFLIAFRSNLLFNTLLCPLSWIIDSHCPELWILQGSVLGLLLFTLYTPLGSPLTESCFDNYFYTDISQPFFGFQQT